MKFSLLRATQWFLIALFVAATVGLTYDFNSEAGKTVNAPVENRLSQGLLGYWKLDDGTGTDATDSSGNANTLAMTGSPSWTTGQIGAYSLDFSGSGQYLSVADPASGILDFVDGADFTIVGWFNRDTFAADHTIVAKKTNQTTNAGYVVWVDNNGSTDYLNFELSDGTDTYSATGATNLSATGWHHFAAVWNDNTGMYLYLDGSLDGSTTTSTSSINSLANANAFRIGAESDAGVPFDGKIDDIRLYGKALSEDAVKRLYQTTVPGDPADTGLVGHWTFDGPDVIWGDASNEIKDVSGKGNHGDATGTTPVRGKLGQGLSFDGTSDYVDVGNPTSLQITGNITACAWIKPSTLNILQRIITKHACCGEWGWVLGTAISNEFYFYISPDGSSWPLNGNLSHASITTNEFTHVCGVYDGSYARIYINGSEDIGGNYPIVYNSGINNNSVDVNIGYDPAIPAYTNASIDDVRIYNRALSATEVLNLYTSGK